MNYYYFIYLICSDLTSKNFSKLKRKTWKIVPKKRKLKRRKIHAANAGIDRTKFVAFARSAALDQSPSDSDDFLRRVDIHICRFFVES